jgi:hypothetical protein
MTIFNAKNSIKILTGLLSLVIIFHILILVKIIPYENAWGGRLKTEQEMFVFETFSIVLNVFLIGILFLKIKHSKNKIINGVLWFFFALFLLNTLGNLLAHTNMEKSFAVLTFLFSLLLLKILLEKK